MDTSSLLQLGAQLFQGQLDADGDGQIEITEIMSALSGLMGNGGNTEAGLDLGGLLSNMDAGGLMGMAQSWLGDGANEAASGEQLTQMFGQDKISAFASQLGLSEDQALKGLQEAVPNMVDKGSEGGSLLDMVGGVSGAIGLASKLFGR